MNILAGSLLLVVVLSVCTHALEVEERKGDKKGKSCHSDRACGKEEKYCCVATGPDQKEGICQERPHFKEACSTRTNKYRLHLDGCPCVYSYQCDYEGPTGTGICGTGAFG
uniref:Ixodegrin B n=1 Tax=Rhipicephalus appendiculatus TaxID=34631 RepID=A0A131YGG2_RHIAP